MNRPGTLYGIGVGPGDAELITVRGARLLGQVPQVFVPKAEPTGTSLAHRIAAQHIGPQARVRELVFPVTDDPQALQQRWQRAAEQIDTELCAGDDVAFLTLGDPLLYSTYVYLLRALRQRRPQAHAVTVPGVPAFGHVAALTDFTLGEGKLPLSLIPTAADLEPLRVAVRSPGTVVIMKVGPRLPQVLDALEAEGVIDEAVFVAHAGQPEQRIETDLRKLRQAPERAGYLSTILVYGRGGDRARDAQEGPA
jgi:precorrin-2/cobalt-factor-2 C20-methyltransferase